MINFTFAKKGEYSIRIQFFKSIHLTIFIHLYIYIKKLLIFENIKCQLNFLFPTVCSKNFQTCLYYNLF